MRESCWKIDETRDNRQATRSPGRGGGEPTDANLKAIVPSRTSPAALQVVCGHRIGLPCCEPLQVSLTLIYRLVGPSVLTCSQWYGGTFCMGGNKLQAGDPSPFGCEEMERGPRDSWVDIWARWSTVIQSRCRKGWFGLGALIKIREPRDLEDLDSYLL